MAETSRSEEGFNGDKATQGLTRSLPVKVRGYNAIRQGFEEYTSTIQVSCNGCVFRSKHFILKGTRVTLEIPNAEKLFEPRQVPATVVRNRAPMMKGEPFEVEVSFEGAGNVWGIAFPPERSAPLRLMGKAEPVRAGVAPAAPASESSPDSSSQKAASERPLEAVRVLPITFTGEQKMPTSSETGWRESRSFAATAPGTAHEPAQVFPASPLAVSAQAGAFHSEPRSSEPSPSVAASGLLSELAEADRRIEAKLQLLREAERRLASTQRTTEMAISALQEKATEIGQKSKAELDRFGETLVAQSKRAIDEALKAQVDACCERIMSAEKDVRAGFDTGLIAAARTYQRHLEGMATSVVEEARGTINDLLAEQETQFRMSSTHGAAEFHEQLAQAITSATESASRGLEQKAELLAQKIAVDVANRIAGENDRRKKEFDESLAQFRQSLESTSNSWRAATVALLMQDTQKLKDKLAAGLMYGLQQSAVKGCVELARVLSQKSFTPAVAPSAAPPDEKSAPVSGATVDANTSFSKAPIAK